ncbi:MAG: cysteine synthase [Epulopiscium sp.]|mgnify:CR=1 FL=1|jgi:cysteine synthase A|uniref:PLP-dependent cysteine synthase family protein n=1 Tax=Defluviitalea raffinosedens TaxID=1450156 RepID=UPI00175CDC43|nr:cysteine synthase family protein [Defluviitalea raffinosedens]MBM7684964.1 cysteine synthase A [Defluviitalea raffinosedens]MDK2786857.1 cysteine synthase [Candidatus Epulonipiscium sp.]HHW68664.1 cysteine synthase family protein [Candidatus Epulonipiscium sp.]
MHYVNHVTELIGNTPIIKINHFDLPGNVQLFAKLEFANPGGSVKDRIGKHFIEKYEKEGRLKKGSTIIEATAGNTGIGIALAAVNRGYRIIFIVPGKFSVEKQMIMKALGAEIINIPTEEGLQGAYRRIEELKKEMDDVLVINQFDNPDNAEAHYLYTGREIYDQMEGKIDVFISGAGSGGTFSGVMKYLKEKNPSIKGVLADPYGSIIGGGACHSYKIEGIGNDFIPGNLEMDFVDDVEKISDEEAFRAVKDLAKKEGLLVGSSSGAVFAAALKQAQKIEKGNIVMIFADRSDRYLSKNIYE